MAILEKYPMQVMQRVCWDCQTNPSKLWNWKLREEAFGTSQPGEALDPNIGHKLLKAQTLACPVLLGLKKQTIWFIWIEGA